jgi:Ribonuclease G/E
MSRLRDANRHDRAFSLRNRERKVWTRVTFAQCPHCEGYSVYRMQEPEAVGFQRYCYLCSFKWNVN